MNVLALMFHRSTYTLFAISFLFVKHEFHIEVGGHTVGTDKKYRETMHNKK